MQLFSCSSCHCNTPSSSLMYLMESLRISLLLSFFVHRMTWQQFPQLSKGSAHILLSVALPVVGKHLPSHGVRVSPHLFHVRVVVGMGVAMTQASNIPPPFSRRMTHPQSSTFWLSVSRWTLGSLAVIIVRVGVEIVCW